MNETTTTGRAGVGGEPAPLDALTVGELEAKIDDYKRLLATVTQPRLVAQAACWLADVALELERRNAPRCPSCSSTTLGRGPLGVMQCERCGAWFGTVPRATFRSICKGGWSPDGGFENARYVDFTVEDDSAHSAARGTRRHHGWINVFDGKWVQVG